MKHTSILVPKGHISVVNIAGTHQILSWVNDYLLQTGKEKLFDIELVGLNMELDQSAGLFPVSPNVAIDEISKTDLIIIPAIHEDFEKSLKENKDFMPWIINQYKEGAEIVSLCISSFFLAETGLLDGKPCSTIGNLQMLLKNYSLMLF